MRSTPRANDLPLRNASRAQPAPSQAKHRNKKWLTLDPTPARPRADPPLARRTLQQRLDDFAVSLPLSAGDKVFDYGIDATRKLGRAASRRLNRLQQNSNAQPPSPLISQPTLVSWDNLDNQRLVDRESVLADQLARSQEWQQNRPHTPSPPRPQRRVVLSTWGAVLEAAYKPPTPPEVQASAPKQSEQPRYEDAADMTRTQRKPARKPVYVDKPLPPVPRPDSLRRKTVIIRPQTAASPKSSNGSLTLQSDANLGAHRPPSPSQSTHRPTSPQFDLYITPRTPTPDALSQQASHPPLNSRSSVDSNQDDTVHAPIIEHSIRTGHVSSHLRQISSGGRIDSWHIQLARADSSGRSVVTSEYEDGATSLWKTLEASAGVKMRNGGDGACVIGEE